MSAETTQEAPAGSPVVGRAIREARLKAEMTQDDLAEALGVTQTCVSYWENARRDLGVTDLLRVAAAVNVPVVSLLGTEYFSAAKPEPGIRKADLDILVAACTSHLPPGTDPEVGEAFARLLEAFDEAHGIEGGVAPEPASTAPGGGRFANIAFMGHNEYTGYVAEVVKHGQPAYRVDLPERLWGGNPDAWVEYAASAWFSERPRSEESVRKAWESQVRAAAERARREAERARARAQRALEAGSDHDPDEDLDDGDGGACEVAWR